MYKRQFTNWPMAVLISTWVASIAVIVPSTCWSALRAAFGANMKRHVNVTIRRNHMVNLLPSLIVPLVP